MKRKIMMLLLLRKGMIPREGHVEILDIDVPRRSVSHVYHRNITSQTIIMDSEQYIYFSLNTFCASCA
jgi:hypothetical protein